jgi:hypothetical protein
LSGAARFVIEAGAPGSNWALEVRQNAAAQAKTRHGKVLSALMAGSCHAFWKSHCTER